MDIVVWPRSLGLGKYEAVFRENEIDETVLPDLTAEDLKELGVTANGAPPQAAGSVGSGARHPRFPQDQNSGPQRCHAEAL